jgi:hypothetical protein
MARSSEAEEEEEALLKLYGVLCSYWLPPILKRPYVPSQSHPKLMLKSLQTSHVPVSSAKHAAAGQDIRP